MLPTGNLNIPISSIDPILFLDHFIPILEMAVIELNGKFCMLLCYELKWDGMCTEWDGR